MANFKWYGDAIPPKFARAAREGINKTMALCVNFAKSQHPWQYRTGIAEQSIRIAQPARTEGSLSYGLWGSVLCNYFRGLEMGTSPHEIPIGPKGFLAFQVNGNWIYTKKAIQHPGNKPFPTLVPAAELNYPFLGELILESMRSAG